MENLRTVRGQRGRVVENTNGKYIIELYANGKWEIPAIGYDKKFETESDTIDYFEKIKSELHS